MNPVDFLDFQKVVPGKSELAFTMKIQVDPNRPRKSGTLSLLAQFKMFRTPKDTTERCNALCRVERILCGNFIHCVVHLNVTHIAHTAV